MPAPENVPLVTSPDGSEGEGINLETSDLEWLDNESVYHANDGLLSSSPEDEHADRNYSGGRDGGRKSAFYDYKQEKILKQTDAKLFYQQQQQGGSGWNSPIMRASTWGAPGGGVSRAASVSSSHQHPHIHPHSQQYLGPAAGAAIGSAAGSRGMGASTAPVGLATMGKPKEHGGAQIPEMSRVDPQDVFVSDRDMAHPHYNVSSPGEVSLALQGSYVDSRCSWIHTLLIFSSVEAQEQNW